MTQAEFVQCFGSVFEETPMVAALIRAHHQLNTTNYKRLQALNTAYKEMFNFPFVVAVKELTVEDIIAAM